MSALTKIHPLPTVHYTPLARWQEQRPVALVYSAAALRAATDASLRLPLTWQGEVTEATEAHWRQLGADLRGEVIYAVGGGLAMDAGKYLAQQHSLPLIGVPRRFPSTRPGPGQLACGAMAAYAIWKRARRNNYCWISSCSPPPRPSCAPPASVTCSASPPDSGIDALPSARGGIPQMSATSLMPRARPRPSCRARWLARRRLGGAQRPVCASCAIASRWKCNYAISSGIRARKKAASIILPMPSRT